MAQKKVNWPIAYAVTGMIDALQLVGDIIPGVDFIVIPANEIIDVAIGGAMAWWARRIGALDLSSGAAIFVTFLIEEASGAAAPFWIGDIMILHAKYKANQVKIGGAIISGVTNQNGRREPTGRITPLNRGDRRQPM